MNKLKKVKKVERKWKKSENNMEKSEKKSNILLCLEHCLCIGVGIFACSVHGICLQLLDVGLGRVVVGKLYEDEIGVFIHHAQHTRADVSRRHLHLRSQYSA
jgi:hypothetical protein